MILRNMSVNPSLKGLLKETSKSLGKQCTGYWWRIQNFPSAMPGVFMAFGIRSFTVTMLFLTRIFGQYFIITFLSSRQKCLI